jgi:hypothetical protein
MEKQTQLSVFVKNFTTIMVENLRELGSKNLNIPDTISYLVFDGDDGFGILGGPLPDTDFERFLMKEVGVQSVEQSGGEIICSCETSIVDGTIILSFVEHLNDGKEYTKEFPIKLNVPIFKFEDAEIILN